MAALEGLGLGGELPVIPQGRGCQVGAPSYRRIQALEYG
jgi:hypothetical protein